MIYVLGGGADINFKVVGGTTQPASPKENTIWVNTGTKINEWTFSATQPVNPTDGMVWVSTGTSSGVEFNALKKNGIQVYPISAKQYVSGNWQNKTAKSYQNGAWVDWMVYAYNGESSGWASYKPTNNGGWTIGTLTLNNAMVLTNTSTTSQIVVVSGKMYDLTNVKTIEFTIDQSTALSTNKHAYVGICNAQTWSWNPGDGKTPPSAYAKAYTQITKAGNIQVDVSAFTGNYYLFICSVEKQTVVCSKIILRN